VRRWDLAIDLSASRGGPLFLRLARALADAIRAGKLRPGAPFPGSRTLAQRLGVHRNTVVAAYAELASEGWITTAAGRGTFVSAALPERSRRSAAGPPAGPPGRAGFELPASAVPELLPVAPAHAKYLLLGGLPDPRLMPSAELARAWRRALRRPAHLSYGDGRGHPRLRAALAEMLGTTRGLPHGADGLLVTRGAQMAIALAARAILSPGDAVAVEGLGYRPAWAALRLAGARLLPVPVDRDGIDVAALASLHGRERLAAVYLTPHHQYPTTVALSPARRVALLDFAARHRVALLEDDYDNEFHYQGRPLLPLASADRAGVVVYVGTLSKIVAPGLRLGFAAAPPPVLERMLAHRVHLDRQGDLVLEAAVAELLEEGEIQRHVWRTRRAYLARRDAIAAALKSRLGGALTFQVPPGGIALWCRTAPGIDAGAWAEAALSAGVAVQLGRQFAFDGRARPFLRLGFARHDERELTAAVELISAALPAAARGGVRIRPGARGATAPGAVARPREP
jgi:GntR family transcriptional regulator/MocR family aminotransferase